MKNLKMTAALMLAITLAAGTPAFAAEDAVTKLGRGITNIVTSPLEYFTQYEIVSQDENFLTTMIAVPIYGTVFAVGRILGGAYETVTFLLPYPANYRPLMDPPTPIESWKSVHSTS